MSKDRNDKFPKHFSEFIKLLNKHKVEYLLIGGYAMGAYGHIRGTNVLDILINATNDNALKMENACVEYGIPKKSIQRKMFLVQQMIGIGEPPLRIEVIKKLDAVDFSYAYRRCEKREVDGVEINVIELNDLILLKKAAVRDRNKARDKEDLTFLEKLKKKLTNKG